MSNYTRNSTFMQKRLFQPKYIVCPKSITDTYKRITEVAKTDVYLTDPSFRLIPVSECRVPYRLTRNFLPRRQDFDLENV